MHKQDSLEILLYCIIRAIHKVAAPEAMILIVKAAAQELINYLTMKGIINYTENDYKNIQKIMNTLEKFEITSNTQLLKIENKIKVKGVCKLAKLCKCVDKVLEKRQDIKSMFKERPCAIAMLLEAYMEEKDVEYETRVRCGEGIFEILIWYM